MVQGPRVPAGEPWGVTFFFPYLFTTPVILFPQPTISHSSVFPSGASRLKVLFTRYDRFREAEHEHRDDRNDRCDYPAEDMGCAEIDVHTSAVVCWSGSAHWGQGIYLISSGCLLGLRTLLI